MLYASSGQAGRAGRPQQVERQDKDENRQARDNREPGRAFQQRRTLVEVATPGGRRRLHAHAEVAQARLREHRESEAERRLDDERRRRVRHDVANHDSRVRRAERARGEHVVAFAQREHLAAGQPGEDRNGRDSDGDHHVRQARAQHRDDGERQDDAWEGDERVQDAHDQFVHRAAEVAREEPQRGTNRKRYPDRDQRPP